MTIFLTSTSKRRRDLLIQIGLLEHIDFKQGDVPNRSTFQEADEVLTLEEVKEKAVIAARRKVAGAHEAGYFETQHLDPSQTVLIGAVTVVFFNNRVLAKPLPVDPAIADPGQISRAKTRARQMLSELRDQSFHVLTGLAVAQGDDLRNECVSCVVTQVKMKNYGDEEIEGYLRTAESLYEAGGLNIHKQGVVLFEKIKGSYSNVLGLPLAELIHLLSSPFFSDRVDLRLSEPDRGAYSRPVPVGRISSRMSPRLLLASKSPRRFELLKQIFSANKIEVLVSRQEELYQDETPETRVKRLALEKARAVWRRQDYSPTIEVVIGADTEVVLDGRALGQPAGDEEARQMLRTLSGRTHQVMTGLALIGTKDGREHVECAITHVTFKELTGAEIEAYVESGEPDDKAGAYGIQSKGALFIEAIDGSYSNVVGLPLEKLADILDKEFGMPIWGFDNDSNWR